MDDKTIQRKLNQLVKICNELDAEAKRMYGPTGNLFYEAEGVFYIMEGDVNAGAIERQTYVRYASSGACMLGAGAW